MTTKEYYNTHKEKILAYQKEYNCNHREKRNAYIREYRHTHKEKIKNYNLKSNHGLSITEFDNLLLAQDNKCLICGQPLDLLNPKLIHIDHNHLTGKVRGILCNKCNMAIGLLRDNPEYIRNALEYLERDKE